MARDDPKGLGRGRIVDGWRCFSCYRGYVARPFTGRTAGASPRSKDRFDRGVFRGEKPRPAETSGTATRKGCRPQGAALQGAGSSPGDAFVAAHILERVLGYHRGYVARPFRGRTPGASPRSKERFDRGVFRGEKPRPAETSGTATRKDCRPQGAALQGAGSSLGDASVAAHILERVLGYYRGYVARPFRGRTANARDIYREGTQQPHRASQAASPAAASPAVTDAMQT